MKKKKSSIISVLWLACLMLVTPFLLLSLLNNVHPFFNSLSDVRNWIAGALIIAALPLIFTDLRRTALMLMLFSFLIISMSWKTNGVYPSQPQEKSNTVYTLLQANLRYDNHQHKKFLAFINQEKPDLITYQEGARQWQGVLKELEKKYPYRIDCPRRMKIIGATGILSRFPFSKTHKSSCPLGETIALGTFDINGHDITIMTAHLQWPWPYRQYLQLDDLQKKLKLPENTMRLIAGDFNAVTWSNTVKQMEKLTKTKHVAGIGPTWLSYKVPASFRPYLGLPIDQVLVSHDIRVLYAKPTSSIGSDHLPVKMQFILP